MKLNILDFVFKGKSRVEVVADPKSAQNSKYGLIWEILQSVFLRHIFLMFFGGDSREGLGFHHTLLSVNHSTLSYSVVSYTYSQLLDCVGEKKFVYPKLSS